MFVSDCTLWNSSDIILVRMVWCQVMVGKHWLRMGRVVGESYMRMRMAVGDSSMRMRMAVGDSGMSKGMGSSWTMARMKRFWMMETKSMMRLG